jgi:hypothetical protein
VGRCRHRRRRLGGYPLAAILLFSSVFAAPAQEAEAPPSAVLIVEQYVNRHYGALPLAPAAPRNKFAPVALGFTVAVGSAALALLPSIFQWDIAPDKAVNSYGGWGLLWGLAAFMGMTGMAYSLDSSTPVDRRAMYGELLDIPDEEEKEKAAVRILKDLHDENRKQRIRKGLSSFLLLAVPVTGYLVTEGFLGRGSAYLFSDIGFAAGYSLSLIEPWNALRWPTYEERLYKNYLSSREEMNQ